MSNALDADQRTRLERIVRQARDLLETDLAGQASGRFGIDPDGTIADEDDLRLDATSLAARRELVDVVSHLRSEGDNKQGSIPRLLREAIFTNLNRLVAIRIAEALRLLPPSLANGRQSQGFRDVLELAPLLSGDETSGYWTYLKLCGDELAGDVPNLFDPRNPLLVLTPSPGALDDLVELLAASAAAELWTAPDCLGWVYQFFNTADERRAMREESATPRNSRELAVRNQFFTPRYVVDFLVQNSLGRRLLDAEPASPLLADLPFLINPPTEQGDPVSLDRVSVLDPACGSGHFLLAAYDVLERAWHHAGVNAADAAPHILSSLWGIDIDPRCSQVAAAAVIFRARRSCPDGDLPRPNLICARSLPATTTGLLELLEELPRSQRTLVERFTAALSDAPVLGPLLKIEERLTSEVRDTAFGSSAPRGSLADALPVEMLQELEADLLGVLRHIADATTATPAERLLAAEADDAIHLVQALQRRYDAVFMNPPFGEPVADTKRYLRAEYPAAPSSLFLESCFVLRGLELANPSGYVGAITSRSGLFLSTYERWRESALLNGRLRTLLDLGFGVMEQAMVEAAAYVVGHSREKAHAVFLRLVRDTDRGAALAEVMAHVTSGEVDNRVYHVELAQLEKLPRKAIAYWLAPWVHQTFSALPSVEDVAADVRIGSWPADDFRFLRLWWEHSGRSPRHWVNYAKGGTYALYYGEPHLVVAWDSNRGTFLDFYGYAARPTHIPHNVSYYFRPGLTWSRRTASNFAVRILPSESIFADKGPGIFAAGDTEPLALLAWLNSRYARLFIEAQVAAGEEVQSGSASRSYEVGIVQRLPWPGNQMSQTLLALVQHAARDIASAVRLWDVFDETTRSFVRPAVWPLSESIEAAAVHRMEDREASELQVLALTYSIDQAFESVLSIDASTRDYIDQQVGPHPDSYPAVTGDSVRTIVAELYPMSIDDVVDTAVARVGGRRYLSTMSHYANRRLELIAHTAQCNCESIVATRRQLGILPAEEPYRSADELFSYLVGLAFGRWDIRIARDPMLATALPPLFGPLPTFSPGMLTHQRAFPGIDAGNEYPLELPPAGVLVDQPGHRWDVEGRLLATATVAFDKPEAVISDLVRIFRRGSLRDHLRKRFFRDHISRYSKSRRNAPIYWPLYVPSGNWGAWVYAPTLSRESLFAVARAAVERIDAAEIESRRLQRERDSGGGGRSAREIANALESEEQLAEELRSFRHEVDRISGLGWEPDLDDGIILCAAPLADLFPAWTDAAVARQEIKDGKYPWASVSKWADEL